MRRYLRDPIVLACAAVVVIGLLVALVWAANTPESAQEAEDRSTAAQPAVDDTDGAGALDLEDVDDVREIVGRTVVADSTLVEDVPGDEGFWVGTGGDSAWVQLETAGESPYEIQAGQRVSFTGEVVAHEPDFAQRPEFDESDAEALVEAGAHVEVDIDDLTIVD